MNPLDFYREIPPMSVMTGKQLTSTYWADFRVGAELDGESGIRDTYKRALALAKEDKVYGTELSLVLNWLCWYYHEQGNFKISKVFDELYYDWRNWILDNWPKDWREYYLKETD